MLTEKQALENPAGKGRDPPQALEMPDRPVTSFLWFTSPLLTLRYIIWKNHKWLIIKVVALILVALFILLIIYQLPSTIITQIFSKVG